MATMNKNAETIKNALKAYKAKRDAADEKVKRIREDYGEEAAQHEQERQNKLLKGSRTETENAIRAAIGEGRKDAEAWGQLDGSKMTEDIKLLEAGLVDAKDFDGLKEKYQDNATMLSALKKYGDQRNAAAAKEAHEKGEHIQFSEPFNVRDIPTAEEKARVWGVAQQQALNMLDAMDGTGIYGDPRNWGARMVKDNVPEQIEHFGETL